MASVFFFYLYIFSFYLLDPHALIQLFLYPSGYVFAGLWCV